MIEWVKGLTAVLLMIFDAGVLCSIYSNHLKSMMDETINFKRRNKILLITTVVVNCFSGLAITISSYYR